MISDLKDRIMEITESVQQTEPNLKKEKQSKRSIVYYKAWQSMHNRKEKKEKRGLKMHLKKWCWKFSKFKGGNRHPDTRTESSKQDEPRNIYSKYIIIKMTKVKYKESILEAAREKQSFNYMGTPMNFITWFLYRNITGQ